MHVKPEGANGSRLLALDSLRAIAALSVLLYHYTKGYELIVGPHATPLPTFALGYLGVDLFFVISGFVIAWTLQRSASFSDFAFGRVARLYPAYLACATLSAIVTFGFGFNPAKIHPSDLPWNVVIGLPPLVGANNLDPSYWTLGMEVSFYAMAAAFTFAFPKLRLEIFCLAWLAVSFGARALLSEDDTIRLLLASSYSPLFVAGAMLFAASENMQPDRLTCTTLAAAIAMCFIGDDPHWIRLTNGAGQCMFIALVFAAATGRLAGFGSFGPLVTLGQASYSLYLIHQIVGYFIISNLERFGVPPLISIAISTSIAIWAALRIRSWIEIPAQHILRNAARRYQLRQQPARQRHCEGEAFCLTSRTGAGAIAGDAPGSLAATTSSTSSGHRPFSCPASADEVGPVVLPRDEQSLRS